MSRRQSIRDAYGRVWCPRCESYKPEAEFYSAPGKPRGVSGYCKLCQNRYRQGRYAQGLGRNPKLSHERMVVSGANANAKKYGVEGRLTVRDWIAVRDRFGGRCLACGTTQGVGIDHIVPFSRGGANTVDNIQPLCALCNRRKTTQVIDYREGTPRVIDASMPHIRAKVTPHDVSHLRPLFEQGMTFPQIAEHLGVCTRTVYRIHKRLFG